MDVNKDWIKSRIRDLEVSTLQKVFACESPEAVEAAITYARFLSSLGVDPENCPVFLRILEIDNHWVVDALIGNQDPLKILSSVQPSEVLVRHIFNMLTRWHRGGIYSKNLVVIVGVLKAVYASAREGYRLYPLALPELNALGKHLDKSAGQSDPVNRTILDCLDKLTHLEDATNPELDRIAVQASVIRNAFFDDRKKMEDVIPEVLLTAKAKPSEAKPRKAQPFRGEEETPAPSQRRKK